MEKSMLIIGAGIAGLSAGCYGQMNGYKTQLFEMHDKPGGGAPAVAVLGRNAIQIICKRDMLISNSYSIKLPFMVGRIGIICGRK
jgi:2-polyprenyl-6-methoxyphenol hydroxylase-like FAD-dependent oxidoreductase